VICGWILKLEKASTDKPNARKDFLRFVRSPCSGSLMAVQFLSLLLLSALYHQGPAATKTDLGGIFTVGIETAV